MPGRFIMHHLRALAKGTIDKARATWATLRQHLARFEPQRGNTSARIEREVLRAQVLPGEDVDLLGAVRNPRLLQQDVRSEGTRLRTVEQRQHDVDLQVR